MATISIKSPAGQLTIQDENGDDRWTPEVDSITLNGMTVLPEDEQVSNFLRGLQVGTFQRSHANFFKKVHLGAFAEHTASMETARRAIDAGDGFAAAEASRLAMHKAKEADIYQWVFVGINRAYKDVATIFHGKVQAAAKSGHASLAAFYWVLVDVFFGWRAPQSFPDFQKGIGAKHALYAQMSKLFFERAEMLMAQPEGPSKKLNPGGRTQVIALLVFSREMAHRSRVPYNHSREKELLESLAKTEVLLTDTLEALPGTSLQKYLLKDSADPFRFIGFEDYLGGLIP